MKRYFAALGMSVAVIFVGCGGGSDGDGGVNIDATVSYKTSGTYDLSNYISATQNSFNVYKNNTYTNKNGKKSFKDDPEEETYTEKYDINSTAVIVKDAGDEIDSIFVIKSDRILEYDDENSASSIQIARYADIGDYILSISKNENDNIPVEAKSVCKLAKHYDSKTVGSKTYNDVLKVTCVHEANGMSNNKDINISYTADGDSVIYLAKGVGEILSEDVTCEKIDTYLNSTKTTNSTCEKEVSEIISHNLL